MEFTNEELEMLQDALQVQATKYLADGGHWEDKTYKANRELFIKVWTKTN